MGRKNIATVIWPRPQQKRRRQESTSPAAETSLQEAPTDKFDVWLKEKLKSRGVEDLFESISTEVEKEKNKLTLEVKKVVVEEIRLQKEIHNCSRSLLIKNVDKLVADIGEPLSRLSLVD